MRQMLLTILFVLIACGRPSGQISRKEVERIERTLSADSMLGRPSFGIGGQKAARFIEQEFQKIGLQPLQRLARRGNSWRHSHQPSV